MFKLVSSITNYAFPKHVGKPWCVSMIPSSNLLAPAQRKSHQHQIINTDRHNSRTSEKGDHEPDRPHNTSHDQLNRHRHHTSSSRLRGITPSRKTRGLRRPSRRSRCAGARPRARHIIIIDPIINTHRRTNRHRHSRTAAAGLCLHGWRRAGRRRRR